MKPWYEVQSRFYDKTYKRWKAWQEDLSFGTLQRARAHRKSYEKLVTSQGYKVGQQIVTRIVKVQVMK